MKIVSLKRLGNIENELIEKYPIFHFCFMIKQIIFQIMKKRTRGIDRV